LSEREVEELAILVDAKLSKPSVNLAFGGLAVEYLFLESNYVWGGNASPL
jgi:hypothetical protein